MCLYIVNGILKVSCNVRFTSQHSFPAIRLRQGDNKFEMLKRHRFGLVAFETTETGWCDIARDRRLGCVRNDACRHLSAGRGIEMNERLKKRLQHELGTVRKLIAWITEGLQRHIPKHETGTTLRTSSVSVGEDAPPHPVGEQVTRYVTDVSFAIFAT